jgi:D-mannonate dehydratase
MTIKVKLTGYANYLRDLKRMNINSKRYYKNNLEKCREKNRKYYHSHREEISIRRKNRVREIHPYIEKPVISQPIKASIKLKFDKMNQDIERFNKSFECINIDNIAKAIDEYMSIHSLTKVEMNNKLWVFLKDKFGAELTEHRYRFMLTALKKR